MNAEITCPDCKKIFGACQRSLPKFCCFCGFKLPMSIVLDTALHHEEQKQEIESKNLLLADRIKPESENLETESCSGEKHRLRAAGNKLVQALAPESPWAAVKFCGVCGYRYPES